MKHANQKIKFNNKRLGSFPEKIIVEQSSNYFTRIFLANLKLFGREIFAC